MASPPVFQLLKNCAACAAPLAQDHKVRCVRCQTRYCDAACQHGYDDYRYDLRKSIEILEDLVVDLIRVLGVEHEETRLALDLLWQVRDEQLDWCIDDLTPETQDAYAADLLESSTDSEDADAATAS